MKTIIELDMSSNCEERWSNERKMKDILNIDEMKIFIWDLDQYLRNELKYNEKLTKEADDALEKTRKFLHDELQERNLTYILEDQ